MALVASGSDPTVYTLRKNAFDPCNGMHEHFECQ